MNDVKPLIKKMQEDIEKENSLKSNVIKAMARMRETTAKMKFGGLTHREVVSLELLTRYMDENPQSKGMSVSDLTLSLKVSMPQVSRMLKGMEQKGYIERIINDTDRRSTHIKITEIGRMKRKCAIDEIDEYIKNVILRIGKEKIQEMTGLMNELTDIMVEEQMKLKNRNK